MIFMIKETYYIKSVLTLDYKRFFRELKIKFFDIEKGFLPTVSIYLEKAENYQRKDCLNDD